MRRTREARGEGQCGAREDGEGGRRLRSRGHDRRRHDPDAVPVPGIAAGGRPQLGLGRGLRAARGYGRGVADPPSAGVDGGRARAGPDEGEHEPASEGDRGHTLQDEGRDTSTSPVPARRTRRPDRHPILVAPDGRTTSGGRQDPGQSPAEGERATARRRARLLLRATIAERSRCGRPRARLARLLSAARATQFLRRAWELWAKTAIRLPLGWRDRPAGGARSAVGPGVRLAR